MSFTSSVPILLHCGIILWSWISPGRRVGQIVVQLGCVLTESRGFHPSLLFLCHNFKCNAWVCKDQHTGLRSGSLHSDQSSTNAIMIYLAMHYLWHVDSTMLFNLTIELRAYAVLKPLQVVPVHNRYEYQYVMSMWWVINGHWFISINNSFCFVYVCINRKHWCNSECFCFV